MQPRFAGPLGCRLTSFGSAAPFCFWPAAAAVAAALPPLLLSRLESMLGRRCSAAVAC